MYVHEYTHTYIYIYMAHSGCSEGGPTMEVDTRTYLSQRLSLQCHRHGLCEMRNTSKSCWWKGREEPTQQGAGEGIMS